MGGVPQGEQVVTELDDAQTITALKNIFLKHYKDFGITDEQASMLALKFDEDVFDYEYQIEMPRLGQNAQFNVQAIKKVQKDLKKLSNTIDDLKDDIGDRDDNGLKLALDNLNAELQSSLEHWKNQEISSRRNQNPFANIDDLKVPPVKAGRPPNELANTMAIILARQFERITGRKASVTKGTYYEAEARGGRYLHLVKDVFEVYDYTESNAISATNRYEKKKNKTTKA